jgi:hypothetical protein
VAGSPTQIVALDGAKLLALMLAGAVFALAGLWLMFRPQPAGEAARIELFGMKLQASSAGLLVFLIGAVFLAVPILVPERDAPRSVSPALGSASVPASSEAPAGNVNPVGGLVPARQRATGVERELNDSPDTANQIDIGDSIAGVVSKSTEDWFVMPVAATTATVYVRLRSVGNPGSCRIFFYSAGERELRNAAWFPPEHTMESWQLNLDGSGAVFIRLRGSSVDCPYELFTSHKEG